jgi:hypothetical protein
MVEREKWTPDDIAKLQDIPSPKLAAELGQGRYETMAKACEIIMSLRLTPNRSTVSEMDSGAGLDLPG